MIGWIYTLFLSFSLRPPHFTLSSHTAQHGRWSDGVSRYHTTRASLASRSETAISIALYRLPPTRRVWGRTETRILFDVGRRFWAPQSNSKPVKTRYHAGLILVVFRWHSSFARFGACCMVSHATVLRREFVFEVLFGGAIGWLGDTEQLSIRLSATHSVGICLPWPGRIYTITQQQLHFLLIRPTSRDWFVVAGCFPLKPAIHAYLILICIPLISVDRCGPIYTLLLIISRETSANTAHSLPWYN